MFHSEVVLKANIPYQVQMPFSGVVGFRPGYSLMVKYAAGTGNNLYQGGPLAQVYPLAADVDVPFNQIDSGELPWFLCPTDLDVYFSWQGHPVSQVNGACVPDPKAMG